LMTIDISGRLAHNPVHRCDFFYLGKPTISGKPTVVKFSPYQGLKIANFLSMILDQYAEMAENKMSKSLDEIPVIPFLRGKDDRTYSYKDENRLEFWAKPDLDLGNIKASVLLNKTIGLPEVMINTTVSVETSEKLKGWP
ncbi:unnamed protein product, partial [Allacma fusca]